MKFYFSLNQYQHFFPQQVLTSNTGEEISEFG